MGNVTLVTRNKKDIEHKELIETFIHQASTALHRKQLDQELRVEKNKAEEANRLKSAFLANMSHEIRTPMNGILGFSELLRKKNLSEEKKEKYLDIIHNNGEYLINLINDIIDLSKIHANQIVLEKSEFNLNHLLDELHDFFRYSASIAGKNIQLKHVKPFKTENAVIISDKFRLKQVLVNLLSNALKFTEKGYVEYGYKKEGSDKLQFYVKDTGIGLDGNKQRIVFDRFIQADNSISRKFGGSGLGLSICQGLVEMLGGQIEVTSTPDVGSTFFFTIPIKKKQMNNHASLARKDSSNYNPIKTESMKEILIVEDDDTSFVFLRELLSPPAFVVHRAENGMQAVQICKQNKKLNVILMDINLPKMDGIEATKQIRAFNQQIPIIAQTANAMQEDVDLYAEAGCNAVLTKPINTNKLMEMLQRFHHITT